MTSDLLLDSCVVAKLVIPEPDSHLADQLVTEAIDREDSVLAVDFALVEVANVIWKQHLLGKLDADEAREALLDTFALRLQWIPVEPDITRALDLALQYGIAVYDALFVAMAESLDCPSITSDNKLWNRIKADFPQIKLLQ